MGTESTGVVRPCWFTRPILWAWTEIGETFSKLIGSRLTRRVDGRLTGEVADRGAERRTSAQFDKRDGPIC